MREIKLANNKGIAFVDDEDYELLNQYNWHLISREYANTYIKINNKRESKLMHKLILNTYKNLEIDHIDGNGLNNQKSNLRLLTHQQNIMNSFKHKRSSSKFKGVSWHKTGKKWQAYIGFNKKLIYIGLFDFEKEAAKAYNEKAKDLYGKYANLNEV